MLTEAHIKELKRATRVPAAYECSGLLSIIMILGNAKS